MDFILKTIIPVFLTVFAGYFYAKFFKLELKNISNLVIYLTVPCLVFYSIVNSGTVNSSVWIIFAAVLFIIAAGIFIINIFSRVFRFNAKKYYIPVAFMNAGNMGLSLSFFAFGQNGLNFAIYYYFACAVLTFILGPLILDKENRIKNVITMPVLYTGILGILVNLVKARLLIIIKEIELLFIIANGMMSTMKLISQITIPLMLIILGYTLYNVNKSELWRGAIAAITRIVLGFLLSVLFVGILGIGGIAAKIIVLISSQSSPIISIVFAEKYNSDLKTASAAVLISTILSIITIPIILMFIEKVY